MNFLDIIEDKKMGRPLSTEQIRFFAQGAANGSVPDYQLSALLMAIRLNGMDARETTDLTMEMAASGDMLLPDVSGIPVDKHSTGGVGDTTTLILAPLVAACGGKVLKMSGRGLGHTGGTVDKMESIPGMRTTLPENEFIEIVRRNGCAVVGQSSELAPADKRLYALRDVTATVDSIPLIAASILSKKFASGARAIVLDVKTGEGAIMKTVEDSIRLAETMVDIGTLAGRQVIAVISGMQEPLGSHVGNALEVKEAIEVLQGRIPEDEPLVKVSLYLGARMLMAGNVVLDAEEAGRMLVKALRSGTGLEKLRNMIALQGGDGRVCDDTGLLLRAPVILPVLSDTEGYLAATDCTELGRIAQRMGAGRETKEDVIDPAVGFVMKKRIGDHVLKGDVLCELHAASQESASIAAEAFKKALFWSETPVPRAKLIYALVDKDGVHML